MRIAYLTTRFPTLSETFIYREIESLCALGVEIKTYSNRRPLAEHISSETAKYVDQTFYLFPPRWGFFVLTHIRWLCRRPIQYIRLLVNLLLQPHANLKNRLYSTLHFLEGVYLASRLEKDNIEHVHVHLASGAVTVALVATKLTGLEHSFTVHGSALLIDPIILPYKVKNACFVVAVSQYNRNYIIDHVGNEVADKIHVIHCGVDPEIYCPAYFLRPITETIKFLTVGRLISQKAQHIIIEAFAKVRSANIPARLCIIGEGPCRSALKQLTKQLGVQDTVSFAGSMPPERVRKEYNQADIFVISSISEGIPVVLMEAMSSELPVIATRITGIPELVENGVDGILVEPGNPIALAEKMVELARNPDLRTEFSSKGRDKVKAKFNIHRNAEKLYKLFCTYVDSNSQILH